jgi:hypothetical protein
MEKNIKMFEKNNVFGEYSFVTGLPRNSTAKAH